MNPPSPPPSAPAPAGQSFFGTDTLTAYEAKCQAQRIAFAPMVFQACRVLLVTGVLELVRQHGTTGAALDELTPKASLPRHGLKVLLEAGLGIGLFSLQNERFVLTKLGYFMLRDSMTRINLEVVHEVCYRGMFHLETAVREERPAGLKTLGDWTTFYEGLASLTSAARQSWLAFDHYYSDLAFPDALPLVFAERPRRLLDVGGNTGRWAEQCARFNPEVHITLADLPQQLELARENLRQQNLLDRVDLFAVDLLDEASSLPAGYDVIWMSQFLDCFSEAQIVSILRRAARAMSPTTSLFILELLWDRQPNETAAFCLQQTSLYFTCIANGNSQMYRAEDLLRCIQQAGLKLVDQRDQVGLYHTLLTCRRGD